MGGFEERLTSDVTRFYNALAGVPLFYETDEPYRQGADILTLVFDDGKQVELQYQGHGRFDDGAMARIRYIADPTAEQIQKAVEAKGREPVAVRYRYRERGSGVAEIQPVLEFPYSFVSSVLKGERELFSEIPFTIVGGYMLPQSQQ